MHVHRMIPQDMLILLPWTIAKTRFELFATRIIIIQSLLGVLKGTMHGVHAYVSREQLIQRSFIR